MRMNTKWGRRAVVVLVSYSIIHLIVNIIDNRRVIERTEIPKRKESDGPLIMKDIGDRRGKVLTLVENISKFFPLEMLEILQQSNNSLKKCNRNDRVSVKKAPRLYN